MGTQNKQDCPNPIITHAITKLEIISMGNELLCYLMWQYQYVKINRHY